MANYTVTINNNNLFPDGTSIGLYPFSNFTTPDKQQNPSGAPPGSATATATMTSGTASFTNVPEGEYWAVAQVSGVYRYTIANSATRVEPSLNLLHGPQVAATDGQVLTADAASAGGVKWGTASSAPSSGAFANWAIYPWVNSSMGSEVATTAGTLYSASVFIPATCTLTGIIILNGATVAGTDKGIVTIHDNSGTLLANSALAGTTITGTNTFQSVPFTGTLAITTAGIYHLSAQLNGTGTRIKHIDPTLSSVAVKPLTKSTAGTFGTIPTFTPPTTQASGIGPVLFTY